MQQLKRSECAILPLVLKKKWYDLIAFGEKQEKYREAKPYWNKRIGAGLPFNEEVFCSECGKKIDKVMLHKFYFNGDEAEGDFPVDFTAQFTDGGDIGICICTDTRWCGYDLSEEEQAEDISCPHCGKYPFASKHIEVEEPNQLIIGCWTKPIKSNTQKGEENP